MFTVKATYQGETRKLSFPECNSFPSFDQLSIHLYRVFPISQTYFLSKLLFSPDASQSSRILVAREVRTADEYNKSLLPFRGSSWPHASLRFSVMEEAAHKIPSLVARDTRFRPPTNFWSREGVRDRTTTPPHSADTRQQSHSVPPISVSHIPPPPIIFSSNFMPLQAPMDVDPVFPLSSNQAAATQQQQHHDAQPRFSSANAHACCSAADAKAEVQTLLTNFQLDLNRLLLKAFGPSLMTSPNPPLTHSPPVENPYSTATQPIICSKCARRNVGPWYSCDNCHIITCSECRGSTRYSDFCLSTMGSHVMKLRTQPGNSPYFPNMSNMSMGWPPVRPMPPMPPMPPPVPGNLIRLPPWITEPSLTQPFYGVGTPAPVPFIPPSTFTPAMDLSADPPLPPRLPTPPPALPPRPEGLRAEAPAAPQAEVPAPIVHRGIVCDVCDLTIEGIRHKCLDCPDYDLCTPCISNGSAERHNPFHEFFEITEPGRVIVHTVFDGSRGSPTVNAAPSPPNAAPAPLSEEVPVIHFARCDLCDSTIEGDRYKCLSCPDFDTCSSCFSITAEQHPEHSFVKISKPADFIRQGPVNRAMHYANCDACSNTIYGVRYKCMHPDCPDFDLCASCEALPIAVHPDNHPLLKMKTVETVIPTVYRVGQTQLIDEPVARNEPSVPELGSPQLSYRSASPVPAFERGYMGNPYVGQKTRTPSPAPAPPSPFYFPAEQSRPLSPVAPVLVEEQRIPSPQPMPVSMNRWPSPSILPPRLDPIATRQSLFEPGEPTPLFNESYPLLRSPSPPRPPVPERPRFQYSQTASSTMSSSTGSSLINGFYSTREPSGVPDAPPKLPMFDVPGPLISSAFRTPPAESTSREDGGEDMSRAIASAPWNRQNSDLHHLVEKLFSLRVTADDDVAAPAATNEENLAATTASPLTGQEALLTRPPVSFSPPEMEERRASGLPSVLSSHSLAALLNAYQSASSSVIDIASKSPFDEEVNSPFADPEPEIMTRSPFADPEPEEKEKSPVKEPEMIKEPETIKEPQGEPKIPTPLAAVFIADITVRDGQVFPPGAEFVKCWRMMNTGECEWPESTEVVFVAGKSLGMDGTAPQAVKLGAVKPGAEVDVYTGELKAPDVPGSYIGYWRLRDEEGNLFGDSIWIEINVAEASHSESSDESLASSTIIMPHAAQSTSGSPAKHTASTVVTAPSTEDGDTFEGSDNGSDSSSVSLISMPSSTSSDEDNVLWEDSRSHFTSVERPVVTPPATQSQAAVDYVLLYDDTPSSEEE